MLQDQSRSANTARVARRRAKVPMSNHRSCARIVNNAIHRGREECAEPCSMVPEAKRRTRCLNPHYNGTCQQLPDIGVVDGGMEEKEKG